MVERKDFVAGAELGAGRTGMTPADRDLAMLQEMVQAVAPDALRELLGAVAEGATLELQGPRSGAHVPIRGWLENESRELHVQAGGQSGAAVLLELALQWRTHKGQTGRVAIGSLVEPFVPVFPEASLRMWRRAFEQLHMLPALATAGHALVDELVRAYAALELRK